MLPKKIWKARSRMGKRLPSGWGQTTLDYICLPVNKVMPALTPSKHFTYLDIASIDNSTQRVVSPKVYLGIDAPSRARQVVRHGNTLFSTVRTYLKNVAMVPSELDGQVASTGFCVLNPASEVDHRFIFYFVLNDEFLSKLNPLQRGTSYPAVREADVLSQEVPLAPLPEQHRIVAEIEKQFTRLDDSVDALKRAQANLKRYRASVLKAACEGKLVPTEAELARSEGPEYEPADRLLERILIERRAKWESQKKRRGKYKEPVAPDTSDLPDLPEGWVWASLSSIGEVRLGRQRSPKRAVGPNMRPYLRAANITWDGLNLTDVKEMDFNPAEYDTYRLRRGDILLAEASGSADEVGKPAVWDGQIDGCCFQNTLIRVRAFPEIIPYLFHHLLSDARSGALGRAARGVGIHHLGAQRTGVWMVALPPLAEQQRVVADVERRLSVIQQAEAAVEVGLKRAERLRQSILKQAFSGRLVPQDPNDEPASVLLERIRAEREAAEVAAKSSRKPRRRRVKSARKAHIPLPEGAS